MDAILSVRDVLIPYGPIQKLARLKQFQDIQKYLTDWQEGYAITYQSPKLADETFSGVSPEPYTIFTLRNKEWIDELLFFPFFLTAVSNYH